MSTLVSPLPRRSILQLNMVCFALRLAVAVGSARVLFALLGEISKTKAVGFFLIVCMNQALTVAMEAAHAMSRGVAAAARLHASTGLEARHHIGRGTFVAGPVASELGTVGVGSREVEEVDASEGGEEATEQRE